jgi:hypothetical protein
MTIGGYGVSFTPAIEEIKITIDNGGSVISTGESKTNYVASFRGKVVGWRLVGSPSGSIVIDVLKTNGSIPSNVDSICGSEKPTLSAQQYNEDTNLSTWTTRVDKGDIFGINIESVTDITHAVLTISIRQH